MIREEYEEMMKSLNETYEKQENDYKDEIKSEDLLVEYVLQVLEGSDSMTGKRSSKNKLSAVYC